MKISFVVSAFNRPDALKMCLESLAQQSLKDCEIIVTDNAEKKKIKKQHVKLCGKYNALYVDSAKDLIKKTVGGFCYQSANIGVKHATGKFVCFPSDDSYYVPLFAERMVNAAEDFDWDLVYCDMVWGTINGYFLMEGQPHRHYIDKTQFMVKRKKMLPFTFERDGDGRLVERLVNSGLSHGRLGQILAVHN